MGNGDNSNTTVKMEEPSGIGIYIGQIGPPLLLLILFDSPVDSGTLAYWMFGGIAAFISVLALLINFTRRLERLILKVVRIVAA
jgi:hypothetical protein